MTLEDRSWRLGATTAGWSNASNGSLRRLVLRRVTGLFGWQRRPALPWPTAVKAGSPLRKSAGFAISSQRPRLPAVLCGGWRRQPCTAHPCPISATRRGWVLEGFVAPSAPLLPGFPWILKDLAVLTAVHRWTAQRGRPAGGEPPPAQAASTRGLGWSRTFGLNRVCGSDWGRSASPPGAFPLVSAAASACAVPATGLPVPMIVLSVLAAAGVAGDRAGGA